MNDKLYFKFGHEFKSFLDNLPKKDRAKMVRTIQAISRLGLQIAIRQRYVKKLKTNLYEIRSIQGNNIQRGIYFHLEESNYFITHGFTKKTDKTPQREIDHVKSIRDGKIRRHRDEEKL